MSYFKQFVNDFVEYMNWHGYGIKTSIQKFITPKPQRISSLSEFQKARYEASPDALSVIQTYGPWTVDVVVPDWTWDELSKLLRTMPFPMTSFSYSEEVPGYLYANDRKILDDLFASGNLEEETQYVNPLESPRQLFEQRATAYLANLIAQAHTCCREKAGSHSQFGDRFLD